MTRGVGVAGCCSGSDDLGFMDSAGMVVANGKEVRRKLSLDARIAEDALSAISNVFCPLVRRLGMKIK